MVLKTTCHIKSPDKIRYFINRDDGRGFVRISREKYESEKFGRRLDCFYGRTWKSGRMENFVTITGNRFAPDFIA